MEENIFKLWNKNKLFEDNKRNNINCFKIFDYVNKDNAKLYLNNNKLKLILN